MTVNEGVGKLISEKKIINVEEYELIKKAIKTDTNAKISKNR